MEVKWRYVVENLSYIVSNTGLVYDIDCNEYICGKGLRCCVLLREPFRQVAIGILVLEMFTGLCPEGMECCHYDDNAYNNVLTNLRWDTHQANMQDALRNGRRTYAGKGELHVGTKLTEGQVKEAKELRDLGWSYEKLGRRYNVHRCTVSCAVRGISWSHLQEK